MKRFLLLLVSLCCLVCHIHAFDNLKFHTLSHKGGLSYDGIIDIQQDGRGFMWILLGSNLFRFDGYSYKSYKDYFQNKPENVSGYFSNLATDRNGNIYVSASHGLYQYNYTTDSFTKIINSPVPYIHIDPQNRFWVGNDAGYSYLDEEKESVIPDFKGNMMSLNKRTIRENGEDLYFFSIHGKVYKYNPTEMLIDEWHNFEDDFNNAFMSGVTIKNGSLWLLSSKFTLLKIDLQTKQITYRYTYPHSANINIRSLYVSDDETV